MGLLQRTCERLWCSSRFPRAAIAIGALLVLTGSSLGSRAAGAGIVFDGTPGSGAPSATLGGYTMAAFPLDTRPEEVGVVTTIPAPSGSITLSSGVQILAVGSTSNTGLWAGGTYTGKIYWTGGNLANLTMTLPAGTRAFYFYATPFACGTFLMQATAQDGTTSGPTPVTTTCGPGGEPTARYFGFYASGSEQIATIAVAFTDETTPYHSFMVGDFGIAVVADTTPPLIVPSISPQPNANGWNNTNVTVTWSVSDPESGVVSSTGCSPTTLTQETSGRTLTCTAQNGAGLRSSKSVIIKIDKTAPTITFTGNAGTYAVDQTILITCAASDSLSGIAITSCPAVASGPAANFVGTTAATTTTLTATATDNAGNSASAGTTFTVVVDADGICRLTASLRTASAICAHVTSIATAPNDRAKTGELEAFDNFLAAQSGKSIAADLAALLSRLAHLPAGVAAATLISLSPDSGPTAGGTTVLLTGSEITCAPTLPAVSFGGTAAPVTSCGSTSVTATSPAHAAGAVQVTLTNSGGPPSNGLSYTYLAPLSPEFTGQATALNVVTVSYSEPVCRTIPFNPADWTVKNLSAGFVDIVVGDGTPICNVLFSNAVTSARLFLAVPLPAGALVEVHLNELVPGAGNNPDIRDAAGNLITAPQVQTAAATAPPTTPPTITSASGSVGATVVTINFSEPVFCPIPLFVGQFTLNSGNPAVTDPTFTAAGSNPCSSTQPTASSSFALLTSTPLPANTNYTLTFTPFVSNEIENVYLKSVVNPPGSVSTMFNTGVPDITPPTIIDADLLANVGSSDFGDVGDAFVLTFAKKMNGTTIGAVSIQDQDGTAATLTCRGNVSCVWDTAVANVTVTATVDLGLGIAGGTTPGMQIPFNITSLTGFADTSGNVPNILGSSDRLVADEPGG